VVQWFAFLSGILEGQHSNLSQETGYPEGVFMVLLWRFLHMLASWWEKYGEFLHSW
jgi:hypothetical protein